jgi:VIT1/CCC1 family predicted Fe2+/Mn2+ transporter
MKMNETNCVIEGSCKGCRIKTDDNGYVSVEGLYLDKKNVASIKKINEEANTYKETIGFWFGSVAAAGVSDVKDYAIEIEWCNGQKSLAKVTDSTYTRIQATLMVDVKEMQQRKKRLEEMNKNEKKYQLACSYQEQKSIIEAKKLFDELSSYKDSQERSKELQKIIDETNNNPEKEKKIRNLSSEYKKYSNITIILSCLCIIIGVCLATIMALYEDMLYVYNIPMLVFSVCACSFLLGLSYFLMFKSFRKKAHDKSLLEEAYIATELKGSRPSKSFKILSITFIVLTIIFGIISVIIPFN